MKQAIIGTLVALSAAPAFAQPVSFPFAPKEGTEWRLTEQRTQNGSTGIIHGTVRVEKVSADRLEMSWTTVSVEAGGQKLSGYRPDMLIGVPIRYEATAQGAPMKIIGVEPMLDKMMKDMQARDGAADSSSYDAVRKMFLNTDPAALAKRLLLEASLFSTCHGLLLEEGKPRSSQGRSPPLGGGAPVLTNITGELVSSGSATVPAEYRIVQEMDPASLLASITELTNAARRQKGLPPEKGPPPKLSQRTEINCRVDTASGETTWVKSTIQAMLGDKPRSDVRDITVQSMPPKGDKPQ